MRLAQKTFPRLSPSFWKRQTKQLSFRLLHRVQINQRHQVKTEAVHMHLEDPVAKRVHDELEHAGDVKKLISDAQSKPAC